MPDRETTLLHEQFILTSAVEMMIPMSALAGSDRALAFNMADPGFTRTELSDILRHLFTAGDLFAQRTEKREPVGEPFVPTMREVDTALVGETSLVYGLTGQGGARWESIVQPDWHLFVNAWVGYDPDVGEIVAGDRRLIEAYLAAWSYIGGTDEIVSGTETWETLQPWQATYWKVLPLGYRVRFKVQRVTPVAKPQPMHIWDLLWDTSHWDWPANERESLQRSRDRVKDLELRAGGLTDS